MDHLHIDPKTVDLGELVEHGTRLHGHLGPFLVTGIRLGLLALDILESPGYFGIHAESEAGSITPLSCLNDGVQIGSGCTAGKGNLTVVDGGMPRVRFRSDEGKGVEITVRPEAVSTFRAMEIREASEWTQTQPLEALFTWNLLSSV